MGQIVSSQRAVSDKRGEIILQTHQPPAMLEFVPDQSQVISYGIDYQSSPKFRHKTLTRISGEDSHAVTGIFQKTLGFPSANVHSYIASATPEHCTASGIRRTFCEAAGKVDTQGILVFHFTGHGIKVGNSGWGLAPVDFDYTKDHFITGKDMVDWLLGFQGRYVLIILDSCYSGGMAAEIAQITAKQEIPVSGLFVLTSCTADEASLVVSIMGHSIFNYFLTSIMHTNPAVQSGCLPINDVYEECNLCCQAFSSLLLSYDAKEDVLKWKMQQPEIKYYHVTEFVKSVLYSSEEETDAAGPNRFHFVMKYYNFEKCVLKSKPIHDKVMAWLDTTPTALLELYTRGFLDNLLLRQACVASMMYSVASLFLALKQSELAEPNVFLIAFIHVASTIDRIHQDLTLSKKDLRVSLEYYASVLGTHKIKYKELNALYRRIINDIVREEMEIIKGEESTDSARETECGEDTEIREIPVWSPAIWELGDDTGTNN